MERQKLPPVDYSEQFSNEVSPYLDIRADLSQGIEEVVATILAESQGNPHRGLSPDEFSLLEEYYKHKQGQLEGENNAS